MNGTYKISFEGFEPIPITAAEMMFGSNALELARYRGPKLSIKNVAILSSNEYHKSNLIDRNATSNQEVNFERKLNMTAIEMHWK